MHIDTYMHLSRLITARLVVVVVAAVVGGGRGGCVFSWHASHFS